MYFTPDGRWAIVVAEAHRQLDFRDPHTMALHHALRDATVRRASTTWTTPPTAATRSSRASSPGARSSSTCAASRVVKTIELAHGAMPQDVKLSPDGRTFYVADMASTASG